MGINMDKNMMSSAENIWKMLDDMVVNNPDEYQKFVKSHIETGMEDMKKENKKKQESKMV